MKKGIIVIIIIICSIIFAFSDSAFIVNSRELIPFLFTVLGLCLTAYTFIYSPIKKIIERKYNAKEKLSSLLKSFEDDMLCIFFSSILLIFVDFIKFSDIPFLVDFINININIFNIQSLKYVIVNFFIALLAGLSFFAMYDLINATFKILRSSFD